jgi:hypothetical protein
MELTEGSETSAKHNLTPGKYPKEHIQERENLRKKGNVFPLTQLTYQDDFVVKTAALVLCSFDIRLVCFNAL